MLTALIVGLEHILIPHHYSILLLKFGHRTDSVRVLLVVVVDVSIVEIQIPSVVS